MKFHTNITQTIRCIGIFLISHTICLAQEDTTQISHPNFHSSTYYANTLTTHPFGVFISRLNHNFQLKPDKSKSITFSESNGNIWLPLVNAFVPENSVDKAIMRNYVWHKREENLNQINAPTKNIALHADGVLRTYNLNFNKPIFEHSELKMNCRMFTLDKGKAPFSLVTNDEIIEWFHSNIAGGEDPFARKSYTLNSANIYYKDVNNKSLQLVGGEFVFSGIDLSYCYYPNFNFFTKNNIHLNSSLQLGINTTKVNRSIDLGANVGILKKFKVRQNEICFGLSAGALNQKIIHFEGIDLSNKKYLLSNELILEYIINFTKQRYLSLASTWIVTSSYRDKNEFEYLILTGERISTHWNYAISHLYRTQSGNNFVITYSFGKIITWVYIREDLLVDNAPDTQTGVGLRFFLK